jgi:hypothetical protein
VEAAQEEQRGWVEEKPARLQIECFHSEARVQCAHLACWFFPLEARMEFLVPDDQGLVLPEIVRADEYFLFTFIQFNYFTLYPNLAIIFWATVEPPSNLLPPPLGVPSDIGGLFCFSCKDGGGAMAAPPDRGALGFGASSSSSLSCLPAKPLNLLLLSSLMYLGLLLL